MLGMGVTGSSKQAITLMERLGAPVFTDVAARGIIPEDHLLAAGLLSWSSAPAILEESDGMLVLGSRLSEITTLNWDVRLPSKLARVDADATELQGNYPATLAVHADPALVLRQLLDLLPETPGNNPRSAARALIAEHDEKDMPLPESRPGSIHPRAAVRELRAALPRDAIITTDGTATEFWLSEPSFPVFSPAGFLVPEVQQTMGYGLAAAVGAAVGLSEAGSSRPIVCVTGDGSLQMLLGELATAASLGRQLTVVIFEDSYYNALRIYQDGLYGRQVGVALRNPDFTLLGRAYGIDVTRVEGIRDLRRAVEQSLATSKLSIIAIAIDPLPLPDRYARRLQQMAPLEPPV
jgi:acetolactate synthase-1/2/3 large subunit